MLVFTFFLSAVPAIAGPGVDAVSTAPLTLRQAVSAADLPWPPPDVHLVVDKSDRRLEVWSGSERLVQWPVALGGHTRDKVREGDSATPEGTFKVVTRNRQSRFHLFLGINYPLTEDADRGLAQGLITEAQAKRIREADQAGRLPPWNTPLGGEVGLHGGGSSADWTLGCVAVENQQIEEVWAVTRSGSQIVIRP